MRTLSLGLAACLMTLSLVSQASAQGLPGGVISRVPLRRHGLERAWVAQADVAAGRSELADIQLDHGTLFVQSNVGILQAIDAETGRTLWRAQVGNRSYPSVPPGIGEEFIGVANGATLYLLNRKDGRIRWETPLKGSPSAGVSMGPNRVYVPTIRGRVESYATKELQDGRTSIARAGQGQQFLGVSGIPQTAALLTPKAIAVGTATGSVYGFAPDVAGPRFTVDTYGEIVADLAYYNGNVIAASRDNYLYAIKETAGDINWRLSLGEPLNHQPVVVKDKIYVVADLAGMYQVAGDTGAELWLAPGIQQFVAAGANRIYAQDDLGRLQVLDAATGKRMDMLPTTGHAIMLANTENDRVYLASQTGLLHCLRETALTEPLVYRNTDGAPETEQKPLDAAAPAAAAPAVAPIADAVEEEADAADADAAAEEEEAAPAEDAPADDAAAEEEGDLGGFGE
ncbi:MAG: PQQ-binding-like beta-propeller repeat protein [Planctomycetia bacterium]|nr:PQQ-binding-like beta-propeller repeat protein [Planctomycetia bacterium]